MANEAHTVKSRRPSEHPFAVAATLLAFVLLCASCRPDELTKLTDDVVRALRADRSEAERIAQGLITKYGSEADEVFALGGRKVALEIDTSLAGALARTEERTEQIRTIASVACDVVSDIIVTGELPDEASIAEFIRGQVVEGYLGEAAATASDIFETAQAVQNGDLEQTQLGFIQLLYCNILS